MSTLLLVQVDRAEGLPSLGSDGSVDAYCSLELPGSAAQQSATLENTAAPQWNEHFIFPIPTDVPELELSVRVMDRDMDGGDDVLVGFVNVGFPPQPAINSPWTCEFSLQHEKIIVRRSRKNPGSYIARQKKGTEAEGEVAFTKDTKYPLGKLSLTITWLSVQELRDAGEGVIAAQAEIEEVTAQIEAKKVKLTQLQKTADTVAAVAAAAAAEGDGGDADASSAKVEELTGMAQSVEALEAAVAELEAQVVSKDAELESLHKAQEDENIANAAEDTEAQQEREEEVTELKAQLEREYAERVDEAKRRASASLGVKSRKAVAALAKQRRKIGLIEEQLSAFKRVGLSPAQSAAAGKMNQHAVAALLVHETEVIFGLNQGERFS